jgi:DNA-directed RNA polymerase subunit RPC12/RpoP
VDDTAEIRCRRCGERFERTDPRVFGAPVAYACPHCGSSVRLWMAGGQLQYEP